MLILIALSCFGCYFCFETITTWQFSIREYITDNNYTKLDQLYAISAYVSVILALFGGYIIDRIGLRASFIIFSIILTIGQMLFMISSYIPGKRYNIYILALVSQLIYGVGLIVVVICKSVAISNWFIGQEWGLAFGIFISVSNFAIWLNYFTSVIFPDSNKLKIINAIALFLWICSIIPNCIFTRFEKYANEWAASKFNRKEDSVERFRCSSIKKLDKRFWLLCLILLCLFIPRYNFWRVKRSYFEEIFDYQSDDNLLMIFSINFAMTVLFSPIIGLFIDKMGHQITWLIISSILSTISHVIFCVLPKGSNYLVLIPLIIFGLSYAICYVCILTLVPLVVAPNAIGTGFGIVSAWEYFGMSISPLILEVFFKNHELRYKPYMFATFIIFSIISILLSIILYVINMLHIKKQRPAIEIYLSYEKRLQKNNQQATEHDSKDSI